MRTRSGGQGFYDPLSEMNLLFERMFGGVMGPAESTRQVPITVRA